MDIGIHPHTVQLWNVNMCTNIVKIIYNLVNRLNTILASMQTCALFE